MSGCFTSTGKKTNQGEKILELGDLVYTKINDLVIHAIPLSDSYFTTSLRAQGKYYQAFLHPALTFTLSHIAIQLNMENDDILIIEYGQYITKDSNIKPGIFSSSGSKSSDNPREDKNNNSYYYINKDGARITKIDKEKYFKNNEDFDKKCEIITKIIASQHYNIKYEEFNFNIKKVKDNKDANGFHNVECDVKNKITLGELIDNFKGEEWEAKKYNLATHNCQTFGAEVLKILKAVRINERDKIRVIEKMILPNCMIKVLWDNEDLSAINTVGRIPGVGLVFDVFSNFFVKNKKK
jgi:hypothetical protein